MKHILTFLLVSLFTYTSFSTSTESNPTFEDEYVFTIHIGAFVKANLSDFKDIRPYGFMYAQDYNNLMQVYMGDYPTEPNAMKVLEKVKRHGYPNAFITRRNLKKGKNVRIIQVASADIGEDIDWDRYSTAGQLYAVLGDQQIKLVTGPFDSAAATNDYLAKLRLIGFNDAFAKRANNVMLHKITSFEAGQAISYPSEIVVPEEEEEVVSTKPREEVVEVEEVAPPPPSLIVKKKPKTKTPEPKAKEEVLTARDIPEDFDNAAKAGRIEAKPKEEKVVTKPVAKPKPVTFPQPKVRAKVKRTSAIELQKILKTEGVYTNSLDGFYGAGTGKGWEAIKQNNKELKKYILLSTQSEVLTTKGTSDILQHYINSLAATPAKSLKGLETSEAAIAKAYRALYWFNKKGAGQGVNDMMNKAIQQAFSNKKLKNKPKFDYTAKYDYKSVDQLILHLRYIQGASDPEPAAPVWLFAQYPEATKKAYNASSHPIDNDYQVQNVVEVMDWEALNLFKVILADLNTNTGKKAKQQQAVNDNNCSRLLLNAMPLSIEERKKAIDWNTAFWANMDSWAKADPLHQKFMVPLEATYFQTWVHLEDYFMDKGVSPLDAKGLALSVLRNMVDVPLGDKE